MISQKHYVFAEVARQAIAFPLSAVQGVSEASECTHKPSSGVYHFLQASPPAHPEFVVQGLQENKAWIVDRPLMLGDSSTESAPGYRHRTSTAPTMVTGCCL